MWRMRLRTMAVAIGFLAFLMGAYVGLNRRARRLDATA